jgi:hypothetical protein
MIERDLTHGEIINRMDLGNGYNCLCGEPLFEDKYGNATCEACGRKFHLCIGIVGGSVTEEG